jgi:hypothetical protein
MMHTEDRENAFKLSKRLKSKGKSLKEADHPLFPREISMIYVSCPQRQNREIRPTNGS